MANWLAAQKLTTPTTKPGPHRQHIKKARVFRHGLLFGQNTAIQLIFW
jgi:hypothetical protein